MGTKPILAFALVVALAAVSLFGVADRADAHANQVRSSPSPNQQLDESPGRVIVWFSEPIEPSFSRIQVFDVSGEQVDLGDTALDATEPTAMGVSVPASLPNGTYTVAWRNLSTVDGHKVVGSFLFAIGEPVGTGVAVDASQPVLQTPVDPWLRWTFFVGAMVLFGSLLFELVVIGPAFSEAHRGTPRFAAAIAIASATTRLALISAAVVAAAHISALLQQAHVTSDSGITIDGLRTVALESGWGRLWLWKLGALVLAAVGIGAAGLTRAGSEDTDGDRHLLLTESIPGQLGLLAAAGVLVITSLASHNAAAPTDIRTLAIVTDLLHILASGAWVGGLAMLVVGIPALRRSAGAESSRMLSEAVPRFSTLALLSAGTLLITGVFSGYMQVTVPAAARTPYGWALVTKVALIAPLLGLAAYNGFRVARRLGGDPSAPGTLRRFVLLEAGVAALVLLAVGWLASLEPARQYAGRHGIGVDEEARYATTDSGTTMSILVEPAQVGVNTVRVELTDALGRPVTTATDVRVRVRSLEEDLGEQQFSLDALGAGAWVTDDHRLSLAGGYQLDLTVVRTDAFDARASFRFEATGGGGLSDAIAPSTDVAWILFGVQVALLGALCLGVSAPWLAQRVAAPRRILLGAGSALALAGLMVTVNATTFRIGFAEELSNPFPATSVSVQNGLGTYMAVCAECHGLQGRGDGPTGEGLTPPPADLVVHVPLHTDSALFQIIRDGVPGTAMPAQEGSLSDDEMWHLVNFLRAMVENDTAE